MTVKEAKEIAKLNTMGCWWNSPYFPKKDRIPEICNELRLLAEVEQDEQFRGSLIRAAETLQFSPQA